MYPPLELNPVKVESVIVSESGVADVANTARPIVSASGWKFRESSSTAPGVARSMTTMSNESVQVRLNTNGADDKFTLEQTVLTADLGNSPVRPYGEILAHIMDGDPLLSVRNDVAEDLWRILTPVMNAWDDGTVPMDTYRAGSSGPTSWR